MAKRKITKHQFDERVEAHLCKVVHESEYPVGRQNQAADIEDFQTIIDLFDNLISDPEYSWMSSISLPEFASEMLTQSAMDVSQYFQTRDFVETYVQDESQEALDSAAASEELINRTLNRRELYHYHKFVRAKNMNHLKGSVILQCWWEQEVQQEPADYDEMAQEFVYEEKVIKDQFNYDVVDPRNCFMSPEYCYSLQQKRWIIIREEKTLDELRSDAPRWGYFNLDILKDPPKETEAKRDTQDPSNPTRNAENKVPGPFDIYRRYGKFWYLDGEPGIDADGNVKDNAELRECVVTVAVSDNAKVLIGFNEQTYRDANGNPYRPLIRGLCYIHPTRDEGVGDGRYSKDLQRAINDTFNLNNDRTRLATIPTFKVRKFLLQDTDSLYFEPGHPMEVENREDIEEFKISDNIEGGLAQLSLLTNKMQQVNSIYPTTMGNLPDKTSVTATAVMGAGHQSSQRSNYKAMTFEYTALVELYWMIQQMTYQLAKPDTGFKLMGNKVYNFNPSLDYFYKPLSQSIETDEAKAMKIQRWQSILQLVVNLQHPDAPKLFNYIMMQIMELMGDEYMNFAVAMLNPQEPLQATETAGAAGGGVSGASNQYGMPMGLLQGGTREAANESGRMGY